MSFTTNMIGGRLTMYAIERDHGDTTGFFRVDVPEAFHHGAGYQIRVGGWVIGFSFHTVERDRRTAAQEEEEDE